MTVGRPQNSTIPVWQSKSAIQVRAYRFVMGNKGTRADSARLTGLSRTTVIKWWNAVEWTEENSQDFRTVQNWLCDSCTSRNISVQRCADDLGIPYDTANYEMQTSAEISRIIRSEDKFAGILLDF